MMGIESSSRSAPRIEALRIENYRVLRAIELARLTPLTVLVGSNGSGKSTVFDVLEFVSECFRLGLPHAWDRRGRAGEIKSRGSNGPILVEIHYRERRDAQLTTYHLELDEDRSGRPIVLREWLQERTPSGRWLRLLDYSRGRGSAIPSGTPAEGDRRVEIPLKDAQVFAVATLGQLADHPRVSTLRDFITSWYVSSLTAQSVRTSTDAGPQEKLSRSGDNLPNVIQHLSEHHPDRLEEIFQRLRRRVPRFDRVVVEPTSDGRLLLRLKDSPFSRPILSSFASDGSLKMLAHLVLFTDPDPPSLIGIEEPEALLHPRLLPELAEECRAAAERSQLLVTTHSPFFLNALRANEVRVLHRQADGYTRTVRASDIRGIPEFVTEGASLGDLWIEGHFKFGDPLEPDRDESGD